MSETIKIRDFIKREIDIDVYDDVCELIGIAFCGPVELTNAGECEFQDVLDLDIRIYESDYENEAVVCVDNLPNWEKMLRRAKKFFDAAAGYISVSEYNLYFTDGI